MTGQIDDKPCFFAGFIIFEQPKAAIAIFFCCYYYSLNFSADVTFLEFTAVRRGFRGLLRLITLILGYAAFINAIFFMF